MLVGVIGADNSGHGAVSCAYGLLLSLKGALSICDSHQAGVAELSSELDRIMGFIVANALPPHSSEAEAAARSQIAQMKNKVDAELAAITPDKKTAVCRAHGVVELAENYQKQWGDGKLKKYVDDLLSVPRPAVMNPCL